MTLKSDTKFKEKLNCGFKYDMRNLVNINSATQKSEFFFLWALFVQPIQGKEELSFMTLNRDAKFE